MSQPDRISKKEVAALVNVSPRTLRRHSDNYSFLNDCRLGGTGRPTYSRQRVTEEARRRRII